MSSEWSTWYAEEDPTTWVLASILRDRAHAHGDREYLRYGDGGWVTYGDMNARANRIANGLIAHGVQPGESVSVMLPNCEEFLQVWFGILKAGGAYLPLDPNYPAERLAFMLAGIAGSATLARQALWVRRTQRAHLRATQQADQLDATVTAMPVGVLIVATFPPGRRIRSSPSRLCWV